MSKLLFYFIGIYLVSIGIVYLIINLNLLTMGYSFIEYVKFIISNIYFYYILVGILLIYMSVLRKDKKWYTYMIY